MIIYFSIPPDQLATVDRDSLEERVSIVLRAHRAGANLVIFPREVADWLLSEITLIGRDRSTLQRLRLESTQTGDLVRRAAFFIEVVSDPGLLEFRYDKRAVRLSLDHVAFQNVVHRPLLIVEDIATDLPIYDFVFRNVPLHLVGCPVAYEAIHGGGSRTWETAKVKAAEQRIVVAIGDSDRKSPVSSKAKALAIDRMLEDVGWPLLFYALTPGAELENMFPLEVLGSLARVSATIAYNALLTIEAREITSGHAPDERFSLFFDLKKGISPAAIAGVRDMAVRLWIEQKLNLVGLAEHNCNLAGFGNGLARDIASTGQCMSRFRDAIRSPDWQAVYGSFISNLMWLFAAPIVQRT